MIEFPEFKTIEKRLEEAEQKHIKTITSDKEERQEKDKLDQVLDQHTNNIAERRLGQFISRYFIAGALADKDEDEIREIINNDIIIPRRILHSGGKLSYIIRSQIIPKGSTVVRDDWGDAKTQNAIHDWMNVVLPETDKIEDQLMSRWIRLQLDYIRVNILNKKTLVFHDLNEEIISQPQNNQNLSDRLRSML